MSYKLTLIDLCNKVTADLMFKYETVQNKCATGAAMLQEMARAQGIEVKVQGGLWDKNIEHNWCVDPVTKDIYDPTASQFIDGVNGLQSEKSKQSYLANKELLLDLINAELKPPIQFLELQLLLKYFWKS